MRTSFHHQSEAQPPNGPLTAATSPDTPSTCPATQSVSVSCRIVGLSVARSPEISRFGSFVKPLWAMSGLQNYAQQLEVPKVPC